MKTFESLFAELSEKAATKQAGSLTVDELAKGTATSSARRSSKRLERLGSPPNMRVLIERPKK